MLVPAAATSSAAASTHLLGLVRSHGNGLADYTVTLYAAGAEGGGATLLGTATSASDGAFDLTYERPADSNAVLYVLAVGPSAVPNGGAVTLASVLGPGASPPAVVVNERTTVASAYAMTQFSADGSIAGPTPGLPNAARMVGNLVDVGTGEVGRVLGTSPNGLDTTTLRTFNSLANMVAACVASSPICTDLFALATPAGGPAPTTTFDALVAINRNPSHNAADLFTFAPSTPYTPARVDAPDAWTLALRFVGDGQSMDGPGNLAIDTDGNIWVTNNYEFAPDAFTPVCGGKNLLVFSPAGEYLPGSPYTGGGLDGAGFGIDIDPYGDIWVGNYGFAAPVPGCPDEQQPKHDSISQFRADGTPVSPRRGWTAGSVTWPQGTKSDQHGNVWIANCESDSVTVYRDGNPARAQVLRDVGLHKPFAIAHNNEGDAFVTGVGSDNVVMFQPDGTPAPPITGGGLNRPLGIASDSAGNVWVANSGFADLPCPTLDDLGTIGGSVTRISPDGTLASNQPTTGGGLTAPWGVAVDGNDNVWVANFAGQRLSEICGGRPVTCPQGLTTGDPISPHTGYGFDGLVRNTGLAIDPSGNVWIVNNWKEVPIQANPGGYELVAFVGLAGPVHRAPPTARPVPKAPDFTG